MAKEKKGPGSQPVPLEEGEFYAYLKPRAVDGDKVVNEDGRVFFVRPSQGWILNSATNCIGCVMPCLCKHEGERVYVISAR